MQAGSDEDLQEENLRPGGFIHGENKMFRAGTEQIRIYWTKNTARWEKEFRPVVFFRIEEKSLSEKLSQPSGEFLLQSAAGLQR